MTSADDANTLLADALAPSPRSPDQGFAARVRLAVLEEQRFRAWRKTALKRIGSDALILVGLAGPATGLAHVVSIGNPLSAPVAGLFIATLVVGGWMLLSGELRRFQAC